MCAAQPFCPTSGIVGPNMLSSSKTSWAQVWLKRLNTNWFYRNLPAERLHTTLCPACAFVVQSIPNRRRGRNRRATFGCRSLPRWETKCLYWTFRVFAWLFGLHECWLSCSRPSSDVCVQPSVGLDLSLLAVLGQYLHRKEPSDCLPICWMVCPRAAWCAKSCDADRVAASHQNLNRTMFPFIIELVDIDASLASATWNN